VRVELDPLDARREDIPLLVRHLVLRAAKKSPEVGARFVTRVGGRTEARVEASLVAALLRRKLATNVRELDGLLYGAMSESPKDTLSVTEAMQDPPPPQPSRRPSVAPSLSAPEPTREEILACIEREKGNIRNTAAALGFPNRFALYRLMKRYGMDEKG